MITFRRKKTPVKDLMPEALDYLHEQGLNPNIISADQADKVSRVNSRSMVLVSFIQNEYGYYQIQVQDKELYNYTKKLIGEIFKMRILDIDKEHRIITAETDYLGVVLDIIEVLCVKYNLSIVK